MRFGLLMACAVVAGAVPAAASTTLFSDNFDGEGAAGASVLNSNAFANWTVSGNVDLVASGDFGIGCAGGSGKCVDLDGTTGPGVIRTAAPIAFQAGRQVEISFDVSGSQRLDNTGAAGSDLFQFLFTMASGPVGIIDVSCTNMSCINDMPGGINAFSLASTLPYNAPWTTRIFRFTPTAAGSFTIGFATDSADNIGPLLDNVLVTQAPGVPEPASWAMLIAGFGLVGAARRRKAALAA